MTASATIAAPASVARAAEPDLAGAGVQPNAAGFSSKDFAGIFTGSLPCADCPGIDETLQLNPDGSFELTDVYRNRPSGTRLDHRQLELGRKRHARAPGPKQQG